MTTIRYSKCFLKIFHQKIRLRHYHQSSVCLTDDSKVYESQSNSYFDIVISGMGMVGGAFACALGQDELFKNLKIAIIESTNEKQKFELPIIHSNRVSALNQSSVGLLQSKL
jgi:hypothetical protein